jgi:hypothetical protein
VLELSLGLGLAQFMFGFCLVFDLVQDFAVFRRGDCIGSGVFGLFCLSKYPSAEHCPRHALFLMQINTCCAGTGC